MASRRELVKEGVRSGVRKGWSAFLWMGKILVPISLFTALLQWSGWIGRLDFLLAPVMHLLNLPAMAALPIISGILTGVYGGIASMVVLPFTREQMTLLAIFILISHNMLQEGVVQGESGIHPIKATLFRLVGGALTILVVGQFFPGTSAAPSSEAAMAALAVPLLEMLQHWGVTTVRLMVKVFCIIMTLMVVLETMKTLGWIGVVVWLFTPVLWVMGLNRRVGVLWITAVVFGLAYGAAIIVEEAKRGDIRKEELEMLHLSVGINHSMVEDPSLFLALGLSAFWLWVPRLIAAIVAVHLLRLWHRLRPQPEPEGCTPA